MELLTIPQMSEALGLPINLAHQTLRDGELVALRGEDNVRRVPALFVQDGEIVKSLSAVIRLLRDNKYEDEEIVDWLFRTDESLPGSPIEALRENRGTEVKRRAQVAGF